MAATSPYLFVITLLTLLVTSAIAEERIGYNNTTQGVTYDGRSLIINGKRELLFSGSIHYPRSTPDVWPDLLRKARHGGLNVIQTYVFWNIHEPVQGQYNFEGRYDLVRFIKMIQEHGMYATIRLGPFIQAEWNNGGLPYWLREIPNMYFRTNNEPFKYHMEKYAKMIVDKLREAKLLVKQGGPVILMQIENEYGTIQAGYKEEGKKYVEWAANMAMGLKADVPWIMCKQKDAPEAIINSCNSRYCPDVWNGPNRPNKPNLWTENWTAQFRTFGEPPSQRPVEDIAFYTARWFAHNGTLNNYYMYHGGTNFGRTAAHYVTPRYYDEAPLDEYGFQREPKYGHLRDLHRALMLCRKPLLWGTYGIERVNNDIEFRYYKGDGYCAAFLIHNGTSDSQIVKFWGREYHLPAKSVSILPDCKTVVYNSVTINAQHNSRSYTKSELAHKKLNNWEMSTETVPTVDQLQMRNNTPMDLFFLTKDKTDYGFYATSLKLSRRDLPMKKEVHPVLSIVCEAQGLLVFVNGEFVGQGHGNHAQQEFIFEAQINLTAGINNIVILGYHTGFPDSGLYMESRIAKILYVGIEGLNTGTIDITQHTWGHQVGLAGEKALAFTEEGSKNMKWEKLMETSQRPTLTWYKTHFDAPEGRNPVAIRMNSMGKGMVWVNGNSIGRHWVSFQSPLGEPSQIEYHVPRSFLKPTDNFLVIFEEENNVKPEAIEILVVDRDTICSNIAENYPPNVNSWETLNGNFKQVGNDTKPMACLTCPNYKQIVAVEFASFGDPYGSCGNFIEGNCTAPNSQQVVEKYCLWKHSCEIPIQRDLFEKNNDACGDIPKSLAIQVKCAYKK